MPTRRLLITTGVAAVLLLAPGAVASADPGPGGCKAFGENVSDLATGLGSEFGETASTVAKSGPRAFPDAVVKPEQQKFCHPEP